MSFWGKLREEIPHDPERTMMGEDSETNLGTAAAYGIRYLIYVSRFSSTVTLNLPPYITRFITSLNCS